MNQVELADDNANRRYEWVDDGRLIGFIEYSLFGQVAIVTHTEVNANIEGKGYGSALARLALAYLHSHGVQVVPVCGFFAGFIRKNRDCLDRATPESRRVFKL